MPSLSRSFASNPARAAAALTLGLWFWHGGIRGNDTGGIIPWSPDTEFAARDIAGAHCASYGRYAVITSIHPWPGDYIGFVCRLPGRWGPALR